jgi:hypothetical protein
MRANKIKELINYLKTMRKVSIFRFESHFPPKSEIRLCKSSLINLIASRNII